MTHRGQDGYRYVRQYTTPYAGVIRRWALFERRNGRACRMGTAEHEADVSEFLASTLRACEPPDSAKA